MTTVEATQYSRFYNLEFRLPSTQPPDLRLELVMLSKSKLETQLDSATHLRLD